MGKCPSLAVLTAQTDVFPFVHNGTEGKRFCHSPINAHPCLHHAFSLLHHSVNTRVHRESFWNSGDRVANLLQLVQLNTGGKDGRELAGLKEPLPLPVKPILLALVGLRPLEGSVEVLHYHVLHLSFSFFGQHPLFHKSGSIFFVGGRLGSDLLVHAGLGEEGLVKFIMTMQTVAHNIHDAVLLKLLSPFNSQPECTHNFFRVVTIDVKDRGADALRNIRAVGG
mmetsp:Transcript_4859/g.10255  ORF Transcript_4859/g.10255 Transcript_4859/m.10255 type:complete len:224 (-) Transcript_4859:1349-2020(-)